MRFKKKEPESENHSCICGKFIDADWIQCGFNDCPNSWWHINCADLKNIPKAFISKINFICPCSGLEKIDCNGYLIALFFTLCSSNALEPLLF